MTERCLGLLLGLAIFGVAMLLYVRGIIRDIREDKEQGDPQRRDGRGV